MFSQMVAMCSGGLWPPGLQEMLNAWHCWLSLLDPGGSQVSSVVLTGDDATLTFVMIISTSDHTTITTIISHSPPSATAFSL